MKPRVLYWITAISYTVFIFLLSIFALPAAKLFGGESFYHRVLPWICLLFAAVFLLFLWKRYRRLTPLRWLLLILIPPVYFLFYYKLIFKLEEIHLINFALLAIFFKKAFENSGTGRFAFGKAILLTVAVGSLDEFLQLFIPGRFGDWHDVGLCLAASLLGSGLAWVFYL